MPRYTITIFKNAAPVYSINLVMGAKLVEDELYFWFEEPGIRSCWPLKVGERFTLGRDQ